MKWLNRKLVNFKYPPHIFSFLLVIKILYYTVIVQL